MANNNQRMRFDELESKPNKKKKKKFNLFDAFYTKKSNLPDDDGVFHERNFKYFFTLCWNNFTRIFYLNLLFVFGNIGIFVIMLALSQNLHTQAISPVNPLFAPIYGAAQMGITTPGAAAFYAIHGVTSNIALWTPAAYAVLFVGAGLLLITFGPIMAGTTYVHRNIVKGEPIFLWQDFKYAIKRNLRQSLVMGIIDLLFLFVMAYDIYFFYLNPQLPLSGAFIVISLFVLAVYLIMRFYIYIMLITFKLSIFKILKNSLIFAIIGMKRNILAVLGIAFVILLNVGIAILYVPVGVVIPFMITVSLCQFIATYAAWPKVKQIMVDPYYESHPEERPESELNVDAHEVP